MLGDLRNLAARAGARARRCAARRAVRRGRAGAVLLYHRVADVADDPWNLAVSPERFDDHMRMLRRQFHPMSLAELHAGVLGGGVPDRAVAVTFDDGYADNLTHALPLLERAEVPATVFVATEFVPSERPFWWDELTSLVEAGPEREQLHARLAVLCAADREDAMAELREGAAPEAGEGGRPLTLDELGTLAAGGLVDVGAHTRSHPSLPQLSEQAALEELEGSRSDIADWLGKPPVAVAYPFGLHGPRVRRAAKRAGFSIAAGTHAMPVTRLANRFELGRVWVDNRPADWLERRLDAMLGRRAEQLTAHSLLATVAPDAATVLTSAPLG